MSKSLWLARRCPVLNAVSTLGLLVHAGEPVIQPFQGTAGL